MKLDRIALGIGIFAILSVLLVSFCPAVQGPYSAVRGPITTFQAARAAVRLQIAILTILLSLTGMCVGWSLLALSRRPHYYAERHLTSLTNSIIVLRC